MKASGGLTVALSRECTWSLGQSCASRASASCRGAAQALLGEKQTVALARALADADASNAWCARCLSEKCQCSARRACVSPCCA